VKAAHRRKAIQSLFFQRAGVGLLFGHLGFFHDFAGKTWEDKRHPRALRGRLQAPAWRLDARLEGRQWILGDDYGIVDISMIGSVRNQVRMYSACRTPSTWSIMSRCAMCLLG